MTDPVSAAKIEIIVGSERKSYHVGRAISAEEKFYILHSQDCFDHETDLRDCPFSISLDSYGIDLKIWGDHLDAPVQLELVDDKIRPRTSHRHYVKTNISWSGSGRDGDPWVMNSWDTEPCDCRRPWRHERLA